MDDPAFAIDDTVDPNTQTILLHASNHDLEGLKPFLRVPGNASVQDPETGYTPLHSAISACGEAGDASTEEDKADLEKAKAVVRELFLSGAIWNDLDSSNETPGCVAWRLGQKELYQLCVEAGVRAEILLDLMGGYEELGSEDDEEEEEEEVVGHPEATEETQAVSSSAVHEATNGHTHELAVGPAEEDVEMKRDVNSEDYLNSQLRFDDDKLVDADNNGVMMAWETSIMERTVHELLPSSTPPPHSLRILNVGFGMGIVDRMFRALQPLSHHIIEAHPAVLTKVSLPDSDFGSAWEQSAPEGGQYKIHGGKWQVIVPQLVAQGEQFDMIYFDTFGESYAQLKLFFTEYVPDLLADGGKFGWFNGLGADRRICYDVYCRVVEVHLEEVGMGVEWSDVAVGDEVTGGEGEQEKDGKAEGGVWDGVRRKYWTLETYRLPVVTMETA